MSQEQPSPPSADSSLDGSDQFAVRQSKLDHLRESGNDPYRSNWDQSHTSLEALDLLPEELEEGPEVSVAGRIVAFRLMGKASFLKIIDRDGKIQSYVRRDEIGDDEYAAFKKLDLGDFVGIRGPLFRTRTGEITIRAKEYRLVSKALRPLPEKWHGLTDNEQIYRQRYLDLIVNDDSRERFRARSRVIREIREFFWSRDFLEVETPMLQAVSGGAAARPFETRFNALDCDFSLRIALELHLKRLLVGGFDRVFEVGRVFRNEGLSRRHNPEFTMLEAYQAYTDFRGMMELTQSLIQQVAERALGTLQMEREDGEAIDLSGTWKEAKYKDLILGAVGRDDWFDLPKSAKLDKTKELGIEVDPELEDFEITNDVFEKIIEHTLIQPTFVTHIPRELCPLAKITEDDESTIDVFELCINGQEIAPAYSEQNDPFVQREAFMKQVGEETQELDDDFLLALEHGMPPAGGMGLGIDRLVIFLTKASNIRDTILFPTLRPA
ncbi:MAG: lysine--tRNA ligase [Opitutae bacterium]|nr:lysine--tRNA ligase [Opitutae bacterium]|tara:strand:- start:109 stop:1596 length:1488 start_codon:yes stop_codon:yes gene_type:complete